MSVSRSAVDISFWTSSVWVQQQKLCDPLLWNTHKFDSKFSGFFSQISQDAVYDTNQSQCANRDQVREKLLFFRKNLNYTLVLMQSNLKNNGGISTFNLLQNQISPKWEHYSAGGSLRGRGAVLKKTNNRLSERLTAARLKAALLPPEHTLKSLLAFSGET